MKNQILKSILVFLAIGLASPVFANEVTVGEGASATGVPVINAEPQPRVSGTPTPPDASTEPVAEKAVTPEAPVTPLPTQQVLVEPTPQPVTPQPVTQPPAPVTAVTPLATPAAKTTGSMRTTVTSEEESPSMLSRNKDENWYIQAAFGFGDVRYDNAQFENATNALHKNNAIDSYTVSSELGVYWPIGLKQTALGLNVNQVTEDFEGSGGFLQVFQYTTSLSALHFFGGHGVGAGWFMRGEVGRAWYETASMVPSQRVAVDSKSEPGFGTRVGVGYGIPFVSGSTRLLIELTHAARDAEDETTRTTALTMGFLF